MAIAPTSTRRSITILWLAGFFILLVLLTWALNWSRATHQIDQLLHDSWVRLNQSAPPDSVAIAAIDPASLRELGRWPWPREIQILLFEQLARYEVKAAVVDVLYVEPATQFDVDQRLADAISQLSKVYMPVLTEARVGQEAQEKLPVPVLTRAVDALGHIHLPIDSDGIVRRVFLKGGFNSPHWSSLSLAAYADLTGLNDEERDLLPGTRINASGFSNQWEQDNEVLVPFYGPKGTIPNFSAADIISGRLPKQAIKDKVVFVGITSTGVLDVLPTPVSALDQPMPGVEIHANVYAALEDNVLVISVGNHVVVIVALLLLPLMLIVYSQARPQWALLIAIVGSAIPILLSYLLYSFAHLWFAPLSASVPIFLSYILWSWNRLNYLNRFIENETAILKSVVPADNTANDLLAEFFRNAQRHLPIDSWYFSAKGQQFNSGTPLPIKTDAFPMNKWVRQQNVYSKRFPTAGRLQISVAISDPAIAEDVTEFIDTLARIQSRSKPVAFSGSIERLQVNTLKLSDQVAWLRYLSTFSDSMLEGSPAGFLVWNAAGELIRGNELAFKLIDSMPRKSLLADFIKMVTPQGEEDGSQRMQELILDARQWQVTYVNSERELIINFNTVGTSIADRLVCASIIDVSEIRSAERGRAEMVDYLSHDLRSPLISALYLLEGDEDDEEAIPTELAERIEANIHRSLRMMDDLLNIARADSLTAESFEEVLFNATVDNALDQLMPQARSRGIQFELDTSDNDMWMDGDAVSLERAVANIVGNAIKYSAEGGRVWIKTRREGALVRLTVRDEGVGIDPAMMGDLFTRFKRDAKVANQFKGIGLGLAFVSQVVTQHGGDVRAESPGKGTSIIMKLPLSESSL